MKILKKLYIAIIGLLVFFVIPISSFASKYNISSFFLKNNMQVLVITNKKVPVVSHMLWYKVGAIDEEYGKSGLAHFLEHMMFKGTSNYGNGEFSKQIYMLGGNENAFTGSYFTSYYQNISVVGLELAMKLESDRMTNLIFNEEEFKVEKNVIKEERYSRVDREPIKILEEQMKATLFLNHSKGRPIIGWEHEIEGHTLENVKNFYKDYYTPSNAILVVSGDITEEVLRPLAEKYYGGIVSKPKVSRDLFSFKEPRYVTTRNVDYRDKRVKQERLIRYYLAPSQTSDHKEYAYPLVILSELISSNKSSLLYQKMVKEDAVASFVGSNYSDVDIGKTVFSLSVIPSPGHNLEEAQKSLDNFLRNVVNRISVEEIERVKKSLIGNNIYLKEDLKSLANIFGLVLTSGLDISYVEEWEDNIKKVSLEDVKEAAEFLFGKESFVTGKLLAPSNLKEEISK